LFSNLIILPQESNFALDFVRTLTQLGVANSSVACSKPPSEITIARHLIKGYNNMMKVRAKPSSCNQDLLIALIFIKCF